MGRCGANSSWGKQLMALYQNFALLYDDLMKDAPYDQWIDFTEHFIKGKHVGKIVDLGCGTGEITVRLAQKYRHVYGVDLSDAMLAIAEQKALERNVPHTMWVKQDIRHLSGFEDVDLCISYCDVINYIVELKDIQSVFINVHRSLNDGGLFIFDVHSLNYVESSLVNRTFAYKDDEIVYIWNCEEGDVEGEMFHDMTFFYKKDDGPKYERFDELHHQRTYDVETYANLLRKAKFSKIAFYSDFSVEKPFSETDSERIFIVAQK